MEQNRKSQLTVIFFTVFIYLVGFGMIIPIIPILSRDFGANSFETGLLISVYSMMQFIFSPFWGRLSDRYGRRPILLGCLVGEAFAYVLFAFSRNLTWLFLARSLAGFFGASISTASAYISDITPPNERSKGMALIGAAFGLGFVVGPALGGGLTYLGSKISPEPFFGSTFATLFVSGICIVNFLFGLKFLRESLTTKQTQRPHLKRFNLITQYLFKPTVGPLIILFFLMSLSMSSMEATLVLFTADKYAWGLREVSFGFAYIGVLIVLTQGVIVRRLIPKIGERQTLRIGVALMGSGFAGLALAGMTDNRMLSIGLLAIGNTLLAFGNGLTNPSILGSISLLNDSDQQGTAMGVTQSLSALGRIIGPMIGGSIYGIYLYNLNFVGFHFDKGFSMPAPFWFSTLLASLGFGILMAIFKRIPEGGKKI